MSSCFYILDEYFEPLISKNVKSVRNLQDILELFREKYTKNLPPIITTLNWHYIYIKRDSLWFISVIHKCDDRYINLMMIVFYLDQFYRLLKDYFNGKMLTKNLIIDNILLVMELIEESVDFGIVQMTDSSIIRDYIRVKVNDPNLNQDDASDDDDDNAKRGAGFIISYLPTTKPDLGAFIKKKKNTTSVTDKDAIIDNQENGEETYINSYIAKTTIMPVSWRTKGIYYTKNEFFLDVIETVQYLMDFNNGTIKKNLIHGQIKCKSYLSGMPKLKIALNKLLQKDEQFISQSKFHQCVSLNTLLDNSTTPNEDAFDNRKEIEFIPPDGEFVLCEYELKRHVRDPPVIKLTSIEIKPKPKKFKILIHVTVETHFKKQNSTSVLTIKIPILKIFNNYKIDLSKPARFKTDLGQVLFNITDDFLIWEIGAMKGSNGENKKSMTAEFTLFNQEEYDKAREELKTSMNPPPLREGPKLEELYEQTHEEVEEQIIIPINQQLLSMRFEVPYSTCSGLKVEYLKIEEDQLNYQSFPWVRYKTINDDEYAYLI